MPDFHDEPGGGFPLGQAADPTPNDRDEPRCVVQRRRRKAELQRRRAPDRDPAGRPDEWLGVSDRLSRWPSATRPTWDPTTTTAMRGLHRCTVRFCFAADSSTNHQ